MRKSKYILLITALIGLVSCDDFLDSENLNNSEVQSFYNTDEKIKTALFGCYSGMRAPISTEYLMTEMRSDNSFMSVANTSNQVNLNIRDFDIFDPATNNVNIYNYWFSTYKNIRNTNLLLNALKVTYNQGATDLVYEDGFSVLNVSETKRKQYSAQASFIRAYHYFNLVRLFGDVFLISKVVTPDEAKLINRTNKDEIYKLIIADLKNASTNGISTKFTDLATNQQNIGLANKWAAKALLAKVYLTLNNKVDAQKELSEIIAGSGYGLIDTNTPASDYANVFSETNEMNKEILFAIRFKSGGLGQGSSITNLAAPTTGLPAGTVIGNVLGSYGITKEYFQTFEMGDNRRASNATPVSTVPTEKRYYIKKWVTKIPNAFDSELDWPVLRYADVLLMYAEAFGNTSQSLTYINSIRKRAGLPNLTIDPNTNFDFEIKLAKERRAEFGGENQRWFDLLRFQTTLAGFDTKKTLDAHFDNMNSVQAVYSPSPGGFYDATTGVPQDVSEIKGKCNTNRFLLPIPQQEIDTNTTIQIPQNPGY